MRARLSSVVDGVENGVRSCLRVLDVVGKWCAVEVKVSRSRHG